MKLQDAKEVFRTTLLLWCHARVGKDDEDFFTLLACVQGAFLKVCDEMNPLVAEQEKARFKRLVGWYVSDAYSTDECVTDLEYLYEFCSVLKIRMGSMITAIEGFVHDPHPEAEESLDRMAYTMLWDSRLIRDHITDYGDVFPR